MVTCSIWHHFDFFFQPSSQKASAVDIMQLLLYSCSNQYTSCFDCTALIKSLQTENVTNFVQQKGNSFVQSSHYLFRDLSVATSIHGHIVSTAELAMEIASSQKDPQYSGVAAVGLNERHFWFLGGLRDFTNVLPGLGDSRMLFQVVLCL